MRTPASLYRPILIGTLNVSFNVTEENVKALHIINLWNVIHILVKCIIAKYNNKTYPFLMYNLCFVFVFNPVLVDIPSFCFV